METLLFIGPAAARRAWLGATLVVLLALRGITLAQSAETPSPQATASNAPAADTTAGWPKARFVAFSNSVVLPPIAVVSNTALQVGQSGPMVLTRESGNPGVDRKMVAMQLGVPVGVIDRLLERFAQNPEMEVSALAQELRAATIQFRFLLAEMTCYNPPAEGQGAKTNALQALLLGDLPKAQEIYVNLPWPAPPPAPRNLRVVAPEN